MVMSTALLTDRYEFTMLEAAIKSGTAFRRSSFEVFSRSLPPGRRYGIIAGIGRIAEAIQNFTFDDEVLSFLSRNRIVNRETIKYLEGYKFSGDLWAYREGDAYFPFSPVVRVDATFGEAILLETIILSVLNFDSAVASAGCRMIAAARDRDLIEMGSRRTHERSAISAARAAYLVGFTATSNLMAGHIYKIPTAGTISHAFILAHDSEMSAFKAQLATQGPNTTVLVDTYNIEQGIKDAVSVAGPHLGAIRIDSGDPAKESKKARDILDSLGYNDTKIVISGDLDEFALEKLRDSPINSYGVGTKLVTGSGAPTANFVYKLVAIQGKDDHSGMLPVAKKSLNKSTLGGIKIPARLKSTDGHALLEYFCWLEPTDQLQLPENLADTSWRLLQQKLICNGETQSMPTLEEARQFHTRAIGELDYPGLDISPGVAALKTAFLSSDGNLETAKTLSPIKP